MNIPKTDYGAGLYSALQGFERQRAENEGLDIQNKLKPQRLGLDVARHQLNEQRYSPDQLEAMRQYRLSAANNLKNTWRHLTPLGKAQMEENNVLGGLLPNGQNFGQAPQNINQIPMQISQEQANSMAQDPSLANAFTRGYPQQPMGQQQLPGPTQQNAMNQDQMGRQKVAGGRYANYINKQVTDPEDRSRSKAGVNLEITVGDLKNNFSRFADEYTGLGGALNKGADALTSMLTGKDSPALIAQEKFNSARHIAADQLRGYFKGSITNPAMQRLEKLLMDDNLWSTSPGRAKSRLEQAINLVEKELPTYQNTHQGPDGYMPGATTGNIEKKPLTKLFTGGEIKDFMKRNPKLTREQAITSLERFSPPGK